jgi:uncharacterized LabA/DUF88 family protein
VIELRRVVIFVDYQNVYRRARDAFHDHRTDPFWIGQVNPVSLGNLIVRLSGESNRSLQQVRMYRGMPNASKDQTGYAAARRQIADWERSPLVHVTSPPFRYPADYPSTRPQEKGIDVQIAVDFVMMAVRDEYHVGIIMSNDTDLRPPLEEILALNRQTVEVAAWSPPFAQRRRLSVPGVPLRCHWINQIEYENVRDNNDYTNRT